MAPLLDLVGVDIKTLRQLDQGLLPLDRSHRDLSLECRAVVPARSSRHGHLLAHGNHADVARKIRLSHLFKFAEPLLSRYTTEVR